MENLASPKVIKEIIDKYGFKFSKRLGQNFLIDGNVVNKIVHFADIGKDDCVIEIGPGIGTLTQILCQRAGKVIAIEIDKELIPILNENLSGYDNFSLINNDVLKVDINAMTEKEFKGKNIKVVANLPYYVTTPIIMSLLEQKLKISSITIMIQKEVAERISAKPGTKDYGALSIAVQYYSAPEIGFVVTPKCFMPQPKVDSIVIKLNVLEKPSVNARNEKLFFSIIRAAFSQRRKTLANALTNSGFFNISKEKLKEAFEKIGIDENQRGERLSLDQFALLSDTLEGFM